VTQEWDEILRLIATIKLKEVTASDLFRRLNSESSVTPGFLLVSHFARPNRALVKAMNRSGT